MFVNIKKLPLKCSQRPSRACDVVSYIRNLCTEISYHAGDAFECSTPMHNAKLVKDVFSLEYAGNREDKVQSSPSSGRRNYV